MPWTGKSFAQKHNKSLKGAPKKAEKVASIANAACLAAYLFAIAMLSPSGTPRFNAASKSKPKTRKP